MCWSILTLPRTLGGRPTVRGRAVFPPHASPSNLVATQILTSVDAPSTLAQQASCCGSHLIRTGRGAGRARGPRTTPCGRSRTVGGQQHVRTSEHVPEPVVETGGVGGIRAGCGRRPAATAGRLSTPAQPPRRARVLGPVWRFRPAFGCICIPARGVAARTHTARCAALTAPCDPGAAAPSVHDRSATQALDVAREGVALVRVAGFEPTSKPA
jgi:hypothetical protein